MKRLLYISIMLLFNVLSVTAETWTDENGTVWSFNISGTTASMYGDINIPCISGTIPNELVIPSTVYVGETPYTITSFGLYAFKNCSSLTSIYIPEGVTSIGNMAFHGCSNLTSINIPEGVT